MKKPYEAYIDRPVTKDHVTYVEFLEKTYEALTKALIEALKDVMNLIDAEPARIARRDRGMHVNPVEEMYREEIATIEKATGKTWEELNK